jgi:hypothetical protein
MPTALDNGQRSPRALLAVLVRRLTRILSRTRRQPALLLEMPPDF